MDEEIQWQVILKRNKFWAFLNLLISVVLLILTILLLKWWDYEVFLHPYENTETLIGISFALIVLVILIFTFLSQIIKKWVLIADEEGIIDYYSIFSRGQVYPRENIETIVYKRWTNRKSFSRRIIIKFSQWENRKVFILPILTRISFDIWDIKRSTIYYGNKIWKNISVNDYTKDYWLNWIINNFWW